MFVVTVRFEILPGFEEKFRMAVLQQAENSLQLETDCHVFDVCRKTGHAGAFFLYEKYTDSAAFDAHLTSEHFRSFDATVTPWLVAKAVDTWSHTESTE